MKQSVNSFFNESFKFFKIINSYLSFLRFCCEIFHVGVLEKHVLQIMLYIYIYIFNRFLPNEYFSLNF